MYKKLTLENLGKEFVVTHNGKNHTIPSGKFETEMDLGNFIMIKAREFGFSVNTLTQPEEPKVSAIESKEETKEEVAKEEKVEKKKKK